MITGAKFWNDRNRYYVQHNNPTEEILRKRSDGGWLVSCGPTAAVGCIAAMGHQVDITCPGAYKPQPDEVLMDYFNDPRNYEELEKARPETNPADWHGNEIPQFYPVAVLAVFGVAATFNRIYRHKIRVFSKKQQRQCFISRDSMFLAGRDIASDSTEEPGAFRRPKTNGNL